MLAQVRGEDDVELEYNVIVVANEAVRSLENPWVSICRRKCAPASHALQRGLGAVLEGGESDERWQPAGPAGIARCQAAGGC